MGAECVFVGGTEDQKQFAANELLNGKAFAFCLTEPASGSDAASIQTTATREGDEYVIRGNKCFISGAEIADYYVVVTTVDHAAYIRSILPEEKKIARIALRLSPASMAGIVKLRSGESLGILSCSQRFGQLLEEACAAYTDSVAVDQPQLLSEVGDLGAYLRGKTAVLVPQDVEKYAGAEQLAQLRAFAAVGQVIRCVYEMDEGSFLYLQEKLNRLRERKIG